MKWKKNNNPHILPPAVLLTQRLNPGKEKKMLVGIRTDKCQEIINKIEVDFYCTSKYFSTIC